MTSKPPSDDRTQSTDQANDADCGPDSEKLRGALSDMLEGVESDDIFIVPLDSSDTVFSEVRLELVCKLMKRSVESQEGLAEIVGRDPGNVQRDLKLLADEGLVEFEEEGRSKRPYLTYNTIISSAVHCKST